MAYNSFDNAIRVVKADLEKRAGTISGSLSQLDNHQQREQDELLLLRQMHEDRRAMVAMVQAGKRAEQSDTSISY